MNLASIISDFRREHGLSQRQFADLCGLSNGYISMLEKGTNPGTGAPLRPQLPSLKKIAAGMGLTLHDLFTMADDLDVDLSSDPLPDELPDNILPMPDMRRIPLLGTIACGEPILAEENLDGEVDIPAHVQADFALRCKGDSMITARIFDGDIVYIRRQEDVNSGEIAAVLIGDEATLKRVYKYPGRLELRPENPTFPVLQFEGPQLEDVRIIGKAVAFTSNII